MILTGNDHDQMTADRINSISISFYHPHNILNYPPYNISMIADTMVIIVIKHPNLRIFKGFFNINLRIFVYFMEINLRIFNIIRIFALRKYQIVSNFYIKNKEKNI